MRILPTLPVDVLAELTPAVGQHAASRPACRTRSQTERRAPGDRGRTGVDRALGFFTESLDLLAQHDQLVESLEVSQPRTRTSARPGLQSPRSRRSRARCSRATAPSIGVHRGSRRTAPSLLGCTCWRTFCSATVRATRPGSGQGAPHSLALNEDLRVQLAVVRDRGSETRAPRHGEGDPCGRCGRCCR